MLIKDGKVCALIGVALPRSGRRQGVMIEAVQAPAATAGLSAGDVISLSTALRCATSASCATSSP
jgi:hypothetical protein